MAGIAEFKGRSNTEGATICRDLVYDVGMHNGDDAAYYLSQGLRVLAIEADPQLVAQARARFSDELRSGKLTLVNAGIAATSGTGEFWICDEKSVWNSFDRSIASRQGMKHHAVEVPTRTFGEILEEYGVPLYLKIDIEGNDHLCVRELARRALPQFISLESECIGNASAENANGLATLQLLRDIGYRKFKLINQEDFSAHSRSDLTVLLRRLIESAAYGRLRMPAVSRVARLMTNKERLRRRNKYLFAIGSSGPWGKGTPGRWLSFEAASSTYQRARERFFERPGVAKYGFWCDWHATI